MTDTNILDMAAGVFVHHSEGYHQLSLIQQNTIDLIIPHVAAATRSLNQIRDDASFTVVDYGAADGLNSVPMIAACSEELSSEVTQFEWIFNDVSDSANIHKIEGQLEQLPAQKGVPVKLQLAIGDFFNQVVPDKSVDLATSVNAAHWLSKRPPKGSGANILDPDKATKAISARDWVEFLTCRSKELKQGGRLVVTVSATGDGQDYGRTKNDPVVMILNILQVVKDMFDEGIITQEEYESAQVIPAVLRNEADLRAPFEDLESDIYRSLRLVDIRTYYVPCPFYNIWNKHGRMENVSATEVHVTIHVNIAKSVCNCLWKILEETRSKGDQLRILEDFYRRVTDMVRQNLDKCCVYGIIHVIDIVKL